MQTNQARWNTLRTLTGILALALTTTVATQVAKAVDVYTDPVGFITLNVTAGPAKYSFWGLGMTQLPVSRGIVTAVSGTGLTLNSALTAGTYGRAIAPANVTNAAYFIEITSGTYAGVMDDIVSNDTVSVFTASDISSLITAGTTTYKIYPHWNLANLFGTSNTAGFTPGTSEINADQVQIWEAAAQSYATYYFKTNAGGGGTGWRRAGTPTLSRTNATLYIDEGIVVLRRPATPTNTLVVGGVKLGKTITPVVQSGFTFPGNVYASSFTLGNSALYTTNSLTGLKPGTSEINADNVQIWNAISQSYGTYYFKTNAGGGGTGWRRAGAPTVDASSTNITLGGNVVIKRTIATPFNWVTPAPY